jgi:hypothetical protein
MRDRFEISVMLNLPDEKHRYCTFEIGKDKKTALEIFDSLKGRLDPVPTCCIAMELNQAGDPFPIPIATLYCGLEELKENTAILSKEIFRLVHLEHNRFLW